ncbi:thiamine pyrophosphate-binding protein [Pigmentiphaga sp. GD03639]|uniref:thiamine pyrophosphate-binding protein n=1 Tax=unclassified Pigmentiphaga TaxID=2626614 RepID=UPI000B41AE01|nr:MULTISPECIES: thiamine pyrophosphate-binding protein [unclassified Pigmentiphaga]MDH2234689.1 thiamine pyrophosphate-binding protein [Pigmentiphaga sp. GD03639]OVZ64412.1 carboligase [Pigmentiphaga sp. NML030171]
MTHDQAPGRPPTTSLTGAQVLVRLLQAEGVPYVFGIVGGKLAPLLHALSRSSIPFVGVRHEAAGAMMAAAVRAGSGRVAVALGEMGPGGLNLASGAGVAFNNNLAALLITTNQHRAAAYPHHGMFMDMDTRAVLAPLTKWNAVVHDARRLPELVRRAFREALGGRPGPVHLDIPQDVLASTHDWPLDALAIAPSRYRGVAGPRPPAAQVREAASLLAQARRPLIVAGGGVVQAGAAGGVRTLAQRLRAPVVPTQMALGVISSDSQHFIGHGGLIAGAAVARAFDQADVVVSLGCRHSSWMWDERGPLVRSRHRVLNVNIDPSALGAPALHEIGMHSDVREALDDLLACLPQELAAVEDGWLAGLRAVRARYEQALAAMDAPVGQAMHPAALARAIGQAIPDDAVVVFDGGHTSFWSNDLTPVREVRSRFHEPGMSHLGFGLPYALALKLLHPGRAVFNVTGDGSFGFTLQELDTARRHGLPVVNIIHNNEAWGIIRAGQRAQADFELGTGLEGTDYAAIARGFGCHGETVAQPGDLAPALERALASGLPAVLDCRTAFVPHPAMAAFGSMNRYGFEALTRPA